MDPAEEGIYLDLIKYSDEYFLVQNQPNPPPGASGNGLLYTGEAMCVLALQGMLRHEDLMAFVHALSLCEVKGSQGGLYRRAPNQAAQQGPDDYVGIAAAAALLHLDIGARILEYGLTPTPLWGPFSVRYVYNTLRPGTLKHPDGRWNWSAWLGRQPSFRAHLQFCAGRRPPLWLRWAWCWAVATSGILNREGQDERRLAWLLIQGLQGQSWICGQAARLWKWRFRREWGRAGMNALEAAYFQDRNHFLAKWHPPV